MKIRRFLSLLLLICIIFHLVPVAASAAEVASGSYGSNIRWTLDSAGKLTLSGSGSMYEYNGEETPLMPYAQDVKSVVIQSGITTIGYGAFYGFTNLTSVSIPDTVTFISSYAFGYCSSLQSLQLPRDLIVIGNYAFSNSGLRSVTIPSKVTYLSQGTFFECQSLSSVYLPEGLISIGGWAFDHCAALTNITIPSTVTSIGKSAFRYCTSLTKLTLPENLEILGDYVFEGDKILTGMVIPEKITVLGEGLFQYCSSLASVTIPANATQIKSWAFYGCTSLKNASIPNGITQIGQSAFYNCPIPNPNLPAGLTSIGAYAFRGCPNISEIKVPSTVTEIGSYAFAVMENLQKITLPASLKTISEGMFCQSPRLVNVSIPYGVHTIGNWAFDGCANLKAVQIPSSVTTISQGAFGNCQSLETVSYGGSREQWESIVMDTDTRELFGKTDLSFSSKSGLRLVTPPSNAFVQYGATAKISLKAEGEGLTYQWYYKDSGASGFSLTKSFTGNTYSVEMTDSRANRQVYCVIRDQYGNSIQTETLRLCPIVTLIREPASVSVASGKTAKVTVEAKGPGLTYQWYYKNAGSKNFSLTTSFQSNSYSVTMDAARNGRQVYCVVTDQYGNQLTSKIATLSIAPSLKITQQPVSVTVAGGKTATVTVKAQGEGLTYKWYYKNSGSAKFSLTNSFKGASYAVTMDAARNGRQVYCVITDKQGNSVKSNTVTLSMAPSLKITQQPISVTVTGGATARVTVKAEGEGLTYKWYFKNPGSTKFSLTTSFKGASYSVTMDATRNGRQVYCVVTDKQGNSVKSNTVTLSMAPSLKITQQPTSVSVTGGATARVTVKAEGEGLTYKWYFKNPGSAKFSLTTSFQSNTYSVQMNSARSGRQVYCIITDKYGNQVTTNTVTLKVR